MKDTNNDVHIEVGDKGIYIESFYVQCLEM